MVDNPVEYLPNYILNKWYIQEQTPFMGVKNMLDVPTEHLPNYKLTICNILNYTISIRY